MQKILVRVPQWLGDAVVSTVFLTRLKALSPDSRIDVLCQPSLQDLYAAHPSVNAVHTLPYKNGGTVFEVGRTLEREGYACGYILPRSLRSALEIWLAKIPRRIGYSGDGRGFLLTEAIPYDSRALYAHRYLRLIGEQTLPLETQAPFFPKADPASDQVRAWLGHDLIQFKKPFLGLGPASVVPARTWAPEKFAAAANEFLRKKGGTVILLGSAQESTITAKIKSLIDGPSIDTAGKLSLPALGWMISQCDFLLANDSGLMHVASAFGVPTVVPFGASDPSTAVPRFGKFSAIQHKEIPCVPCHRNLCVRFGRYHNECLNSIEVKEVAEAMGL